MKSTAWAWMTALCVATAQAGTNGWTVIGWNDLGMHCMDGNDYSVFSVLPPYNTIQAQLVYRGKLITNNTGITVTYEAVADPDGSINRTSAGKVTFWEWAQKLYGAAPAVDMGLAGFAMPGAANTPQAMHFSGGMFAAEGIPITPYDDAGRKNYYPMMRLTARSNGTLLATADIVLPVSDEMDCRACHASGSGPDARPAGGWFWSCGPEQDVKWNILRLHDEREAANPVFARSLTQAGYRADGLVATVQAGTPILCAKCHKSNALGTSMDGVSHFTHAMHRLHGTVKDPRNGLELDAGSNRDSCYLCHPGSATKCLRGAMGKAIADDGTMEINCQNCHGTLAQVGKPGREGWFEEPNCQSCHSGTATNNSGLIRYLTTFTTNGTWRVPKDRTFATSSNAPAAGLSLYRFSKGHGGLSCEACHGSTHAEFPSLHKNDNLMSQQIQGHGGFLGECTACHGTSPVTVNGGPHGMHPVGTAWISAHQNASKNQCRACHGADWRGTELSRTFGDRTFSTDFGTKRFWKGYQVGCYACHNGPSSSSASPNTPAVVVSLATSTVAGAAVPVRLTATDANGNALTLRVVSQPQHGSLSLLGTNATYFPDPTFVGRDRFTYAAWDGSTDSNLATGTIDVAQGACLLTASAAAPTSGIAGASLPLWSRSSVGQCSNGISQTWSFSDGGADTNANACHVFAQAGVHTWTLVVRAGAVAVTNSGTLTIAAADGDADRDGIPDAWETQWFGSTGVSGGASDFDGDGFTDAHEQVAGTDPLDPNSLLRATGEERPATSGGFVIRWSSASNKLYTVSRTVDLMTGAFVSIATNVPATAPINVWTDSTPAAGAIYRVEIQR